MRRIVRSVALLSSGLLCADVIAQAPAPQTASKFRSPFNMLPGYKLEVRPSFEGEQSGWLRKPGGFVIAWSFDIHGSSIIDSIKQDDVLWRLEPPPSPNETVIVRTRQNRVAISIDTHLNFDATIHSDQELAEMLLMCLTFNNQRGYEVAPDAIIFDPPLK